MSELTVERTGVHEFVGRNERGASVRVGRRGGEGSFSPGELLQIATTACALVTVEDLVTRRVGDDAPLTASVDAQRTPGGHEYESLTVTMPVDLSVLDDADRRILLAIMEKAVRQQCTVSRTIERGAPVELRISA
jgi:uncharacterized OsmC-like protein